MEQLDTSADPASGNGHDTTALAAPPVQPTAIEDDDLAEDLLDDAVIDDDDDDDDVSGDLLFAFDDDAAEPDDDFEDDEFDDEEPFDETDDIVFAGAVETPVGAGDSATDARLRKLEEAARDLAAAEVEREGRRVKRKVTAATTGAGAAGFIPILLQLLDVYNIDPALSATLATVASLLGAAIAGWATPERTPPLPSASAHSLLELAPAKQP